jgi:hypothetical protein
VSFAHETNRIWNTSGAAPGGGYHTGRAETVTDWSIAPDAFWRYLAATAAIQKRAGGLKLLVAYTWSHLQTELGDDDDDRRHAVRALATYDLFRVASVGASYALDSGTPIPRIVSPDPTGAYRARVGLNPGSNVNDPGDDRDPRRPGTDRLNLQLRVRATRFGADFSLYADVINVLDSGAVSAPGSTDFPAVRLQEGRWFRFGLEYRL